MSYLLEADPGIRCLLKKWIRKNNERKDQLEKMLLQLQEDPLYPGLKSHKALSKKTKTLVFSSWVTGEYRLIWNYRENDRILIIDFGTHNEVYL